MSLSGKLRHWFTPHLTNNFRARLLHNSGILAVIGIVLAGNLFLRLLSSSPLHVLGFTSSVTINEVVTDTNQKRAAAGLKPLAYNEKLADAARRKAANMFSENYWAHNSPSGKSPWYWFGQVGYNYVYAGENLAKDFGNTARLMDAWMASPTHKENIVNPKYTEIGIAVVPGSLQGADTVLVVQLFGTEQGGSVTPAATSNQQSAKAPQVAEVKGQAAPVAVDEIKTLGSPVASPVAVAQFKVSQFDLARTVNLATTALFILALILDLLLAENHKLSRRVGNNWAHIVFINVILLATIIVNAGKIL